MKQYRLMLSSNAGMSWYHHGNYGSASNAVNVACKIPDREYKVIDIQTGNIVANGTTRKSHTYQRGRFDYERK